MPFWLGFILLADLVYRPGLGSPPTGYCDVFDSPPNISCGGLGDWAWHLTLPWITLGVAFAAMYAHTARALADRARRIAAAASPDERPDVRAKLRRQSVIAFARRIGRDVGVAIGAAVLVEYVFALGGLGRMLITDGIYTYDVATSEAALLLAVLIALTFDLLVNLIGAALAPEWRREFVRSPARTPRPATR